MGEDLKEIICHLNTSVKSQDSKDPVHQIGKVLNAHMDSLQWIDSHAQSVERKLQVSSSSQSISGFKEFYPVGGEQTG